MSEKQTPSMDEQVAMESTTTSSFETATENTTPTNITAFKNKTEAEEIAKQETPAAELNQSAMSAENSATSAMEKNLAQTAEASTTQTISSDEASLSATELNEDFSQEATLSAENFGEQTSSPSDNQQSFWQKISKNISSTTSKVVITGALFLIIGVATGYYWGTQQTPSYAEQNNQFMNMGQGDMGNSQTENPFGDSEDDTNSF